MGQVLLAPFSLFEIREMNAILPHVRNIFAG
jgi:hypothetical protein